MDAAGCEVVLEDGSGGCASVFSNPSRIISAHAAAEVPVALDAIQQALADGHHLAGYLSYELGYALEPRLAALLPERRALPLLWFACFDEAPVRLQSADAAALWPDERVYATPLSFEWDRAGYRARFDRAMDSIRAGDAYQVNLSMRAKFRLTGSARALYGRLRVHAGDVHGAFVDDGERQILCLSPELYFSIDARRTITTRPMKGTAPRGIDAAADRSLRDQLHRSPKNRAENLMIVDLIRNDLGRVAETGSVEVPELFTLETYPTVHQMTSTVRARMRPGCSVAELLAALYPCGSITGAPRIRTMEIIRRLESSPRGAYCGAIGMFAPDGSAKFSVAIRTLTVSGAAGELGVGGAVMSDSDPDQEYDECVLKARYYDVARRAVALVETMRCADGSWPRRDRHLLRMRTSAQALGIPFDGPRAIGALEHAVAVGATRDCRVRLCLHEEGTFTAGSRPMPARIEPLRFLVHERASRSDDPLTLHKTDWRDALEEARAWANACGADEAILLNERGEVSEGTQTNVFVERRGRLLTPPTAAGALPGCLRAELLETGRCEEAVLAPDDLYGADPVFLGNSLRGLVRAVPARRRCC